MAYEFSCKFLIALVIAIAIAIDVAICQEQNQMHHTATGMRWSRRPQALPTTAPACDNKELLTNLHDRVGNLIALDEDQRSRLENVAQKVTQFETNNLARLDSLAVQQMELLKRFDAFEVVQRLTKRELESLRSVLAANTTLKADRNVPKILSEVNNNDLNALRRVRDVPDERSVGDISDSDKLDALSTLLVSTRAAVSTLQAQLEGDVSRLIQETNRLNRRFVSLQNRQTQQQQQQQPYPGILSYLPPQSPPSRQLITSCSQGTPTSYGILQLRLSENSEPFYVLCDETYMNGGWTIIQNRFSGELNFQRDWNEYKIGFGNLASEFFIGLDKLHALTSQTVQELVIVLEDFEGTQRHASYNLFAIGNEAEYYAIKLLGEYDGDAGDAFSYHAGSKFSTYDNDNDGCVECNCAQAHFGAWWYNWCEMSNLNGKYYKANETVSRFTGMYWHNFHGPNASLKASRMMIRPVVIDPEGRR